MRQEKPDESVTTAGNPGPEEDEQPQQEDLLLLMRLAPGERFFKFYFLSEPGTDQQQGVEHRIITKEHTDGSLEMVSYNVWFADGHAEKRDVIRVPSLSKELLGQIIERVRTQSEVPPEAFREIDLSSCATIEEQLRLLARLSL